MKFQPILKLLFCGLFLFALSTLFYQNGHAINTSLSTDVATQNYASVYQSTTVSAVDTKKDNCDKPHQSSSDKCTADKSKPKS